VTGFISDRVAFELPAPMDAEDTELIRAITRLSGFVESRASELADELGFDLLPRADAPETFPGLSEAFAISMKTKAPLPISNAHSETVIFVSKETNFAMRFWHDVSHVRTGLTFSPVDELELAQDQLDELHAAGFSPDSLESRLLHADLVGQIYCLAVTGRYPTDQRAFVMGCLRQSVDQAVVLVAKEKRSDRAA
jgi:hypothetical protein